MPKAADIEFRELTPEGNVVLRREVKTWEGNQGNFNRAVSDAADQLISHGSGGEIFVQTLEDTDARSLVNRFKGAGSRTREQQGERLGRYRSIKITIVDRSGAVLLDEPLEFPPLRTTPGSTPPPGSKLGSGEPPSINRPPPEVAGKEPAPSKPIMPPLEPPKGETAPPAAPPEIKTPRAGPPEGLATPRTPAGKAPPGGLGRTPGLRPGAVAAGVALEVFNIALLLADIVIQLVVVPWLESLQRKLEASYRKLIEQQIQDYYKRVLQPEVDRKLYCAIEPIRKLESENKQPFATITLKVFFLDKSDRLFDSDPPESIFDLSFDHLTLEALSISDTAGPKSSTPMKKSEERPCFGKLLSCTLFEQSVTFSVEAPPSSEISAKYQGSPPPSCCFIATACFGSPFADEVVLLRRFRDRVLRRSRAGRGFVRLYNAVSPPIARWLQRKSIARCAVRDLAIRPLVGLLRRWRLVDDELPIDCLLSLSLPPAIVNQVGNRDGSAPSSIRCQVRLLRRWRQQLQREQQRLRLSP